MREHTCYVEPVGLDIAAMLSLLQAAAVCKSGLTLLLLIEPAAGFFCPSATLG
jgi:hypothetical protein